MKAKDDQKWFWGLRTPGYYGIRSMSSILLYPSSCMEWWGKKQEEPADQYLEATAWVLLSQREGSLHEGAVLIERALNWTEGEKG